MGRISWSESQANCDCFSVYVVLFSEPVVKCASNDRRLFSFADNASKRMVEIFHRIKIMVVYKTVRRALKANATAVLEELKNKAWEKRFFVSFDNMNFYEQRRDKRLHNKPI